MEIAVFVISDYSVGFLVKLGWRPKMAKKSKDFKSTIYDALKARLGGQ